MTTFTQFGAWLADAYADRAKLSIEITHLELDIEGRKLFLVPPEGWEGKNEEQRRASRDKRFADDERLKEMGDLLQKRRDKLASLDAEIAGQETRFKAARWETRNNLVEALKLYGVTPEEDNKGSEGAFDDSADNAVDTAADEVLEQAMDAVPADAPFDPEDDLPF